MKYLNTYSQLKFNPPKCALSILAHGCLLIRNLVILGECTLGKTLRYVKERSSIRGYVYAEMSEVCTMSCSRRYASLKKLEIHT